MFYFDVGENKRGRFLKVPGFVILSASKFLVKFPFLCSLCIFESYVFFLNIVMIFPLLWEIDPMFMLWHLF